MVTSFSKRPRQSGSEHAWYFSYVDRSMVTAQPSQQVSSQSAPRHWNFPKCRGSRKRVGFLIALRKRFHAVDDVQEIPVSICEKQDPVSLADGRLGQELNAGFAQALARSFEIVDHDCQMANAGIFHLLLATGAFRLNDLEHRSVRGSYEVVAIVLVVDSKLEVVHVPLGQPLRIRRSNRRVLQ